MSEKKILLGNEAIARGAYEAGVKVSAAYPGTPSTEISEAIAKYEEVYAEWSPNEKVAAEVAIGASIAGARSMCSMKHVGVNVAADPLFTAAYAGVGGGMVVVAADDPGMYSSQNEQDSRMVARAAMIPVLEPSDSAEAKAFTKLAFDLSEAYDTPVMVRSTTRLSHSQGIVELEERREKECVPYERNTAKYVMMPGNAIKRHVVVEARMKKLAEDACAMSVNRAEYRDTAVGFITSGIPYQYVREAMPEASVLKLGLVHPLPRKLIEEFASKVEKLYIFEELEPVIEEQVKSWGILKAVGKEIFTVQGEYSANMIRQRVPECRRRCKPVRFRCGGTGGVWGGVRKGGIRGDRSRIGDVRAALHGPGKRSGQAAHPLPGLSPQERILRAEPFKDTRCRRHRLLYPGGGGPSERGGHHHLHGFQHQHPPRHGEGQGEGVHPRLGGRHRGFYVHAHRHQLPDEHGLQPVLRHGGDPGQFHHRHDRPSGPCRHGEDPEGRGGPGHRHHEPVPLPWHRTCV